jgi:hypothetical protein
MMEPDPEFIMVMEEIIRKNNIRSVFESGTYLGTGSTETLAKLFVENNKLPEKFITVETNLDYFIKAKKNLAKYNFIKPVFGLSVDYLEAIKFLVNDRVFENLEKYEEIYIDHLYNPQHYYLKEIMIGVVQEELEKSTKKKNISFFSSGKKETIEFKNNVLSDFCCDLYHGSSLIVLDSAAGIGFYEFTQVNQLMYNREYYLVLDDIEHLKHFRSREYIETHSEEYNIISQSKEAGWLIAKSHRKKNVN